jgi:hypothetical protein
MGWRWKLAGFLVRIAARILGWQEWRFEKDYEWQQETATCYTDAKGILWWQ